MSLYAESAKTWTDIISDKIIQSISNNFIKTLFCVSNCCGEFENAFQIDLFSVYFKWHIYRGPFLVISRSPNRHFFNVELSNWRLNVDTEWWMLKSKLWMLKTTGEKCKQMLNVEMRKLKKKGLCILKTSVEFLKRMLNVEQWILNVVNYCC